MVTSIVIYILSFGIVHKTVVLVVISMIWLLALWRFGARCSEGHWWCAGSWFVVVYMQCDIMTASCEMISHTVLLVYLIYSDGEHFLNKLHEGVQMRCLYLDLLYQDNCHVYCVITQCNANYEYLFEWKQTHRQQLVEIAVHESILTAAPGFSIWFLYHILEAVSRMVADAKCAYGHCVGSPIFLRCGLLWHCLTLRLADWLSSPLANDGGCSLSPPPPPRSPPPPPHPSL